MVSSGGMHYSFYCLRALLSILIMVKTSILLSRGSSRLFVDELRDLTQRANIRLHNPVQAILDYDDGVIVRMLKERMRAAAKLGYSHLDGALFIEHRELVTGGYQCCIRVGGEPILIDDTHELDESIVRVYSSRLLRGAFRNTLATILGVQVMHEDPGDGLRLSAMVFVMNWAPEQRVRARTMLTDRLSKYIHYACILSRDRSMDVSFVHMKFEQMYPTRAKITLWQFTKALRAVLPTIAPGYPLGMSVDENGELRVNMIMV